MVANFQQLGRKACWPTHRASCTRVRASDKSATCCKTSLRQMLCKVSTPTMQKPRAGAGQLGGWLTVQKSKTVGSDGSFFQALVKSQQPACSVWLERVQAIALPILKLCCPVNQLLLVSRKSIPKGACIYLQETGSLRCSAISLATNKQRAPP